jgi:mannonate dehydratase
MTGHHFDHDHGNKRVDGYQLFTRMMEESAGTGLFYGDISAVTLVIKKPKHLKDLLLRDDWADRLINGSDYPLPGVIPLISLSKLAHEGLLPKEAIADLALIRAHNPILFDFAVKRALTWQGKKFSPKIFASRRLFEI